MAGATKQVVPGTSISQQELKARLWDAANSLRALSIRKTSRSTCYFQENY
jgi:hypothetical protein